MSETKKCYICNSNRIDLHKVINNFPILKCKNCQLLWIDKNIEKHELELFYDQSYFYSDNKMGYKDYFKDEKNHRNNAKNLINIVDKIIKLDKLRILDIGCASGFLLDEIRQAKKCQVFGIELSKLCCEYARNELKLNINEDFDEILFEPDFFDVVFLIGTLEHLIDPGKTLTQINKVLAPNGVVVITTLNTKGIIPLYSLKPPEHTFYFSHNNLTKLLNVLNYKVLTIKTYRVNYYLQDLFHRLKEFSSLSFFGYFSSLFYKYFPDLSIKIPTNEMIVIARKIT